MVLILQQDFARSTAKYVLINICNILILCFIMNLDTNVLMDIATYLQIQAQVSNEERGRERERELIYWG